MKKGLISVIVPIYNGESFIEKCFDSILNQTYENFELIIVDDGSTDGSSKICERYVQRDNRVRYYYQINSGAGIARNMGIMSSEGQYITFIDSDDWVEKDYLEVLMDNIEGVDIVDFCEYNYSSDGESIAFCRSNPGIKGVYDGREICKLGYKGIYRGFGVPWGKLYRKELWEETRFPCMRRFEDTAVMHKIYWNARINIVDAQMYCYRMARPNSIMHSKFNIEWLNSLDVSCDKIDFFLAQNDGELAWMALGEFCNSYKSNYKKVKSQMPDKLNQMKPYKEVLLKKIVALNGSKCNLLIKLKVIIKTIIIVIMPPFY